jgi:integrase
MAELRRHAGIGALPLEFCILTATRTSETLLTDWTEIDLSKRLWTIPGPRRKGKKGATPDLAIPLSDRAMAILKETVDRTGGVGLVFQNDKGRRLSENTLLDTAKQLGQKITTHGFRSTFRDWAGDETNFPREICEAALGHKVGNDAELAYRRGSALQKRAQLMAAWARHCETPSVKRTGNVVAIGMAP